MDTNESLWRAEQKLLAANLRYQLIEISHHTKGAHLAGALSCVDLLVSLYQSYDQAIRLKIQPGGEQAPNRDRLIFSKGHAASALYVMLAHLGFFPKENLVRYNQPHANLPEQPCPGTTPGVEWATGSLGHGIGVALGIALGGKIQTTPFRTFAILSDGECQEGSVWEAAMLAPKLNKNPITVLIDYNKWQATGRSNDIMQMQDLQSKWEAFGWQAHRVDGHNHEEIEAALSAPQTGHKAIIADTIKGKGVSFIEDDNNWHYRSPTLQEVEQARLELGATCQNLFPTSL